MAAGSSRPATSGYDVIIVNLPDPQTAQLNRFYTLEFFDEASRRLTDSRSPGAPTRGSEDYLSPGLADFLRSIHKTLRAVFPEVAVIPGETIHFLAARRKGALPSDADELLARLRERHLATRYVREYYLPFRMMPDRVADLEAQIQPAAANAGQSRFRAGGLLFQPGVVERPFPARIRRGVPGAGARQFRRGRGGAGGAAGVSRWPWGGAAPAAQAALATAAMGFTMIGLEILLLLAFQAIYGCVYQQLAMVIGAFMAGMAAGSWLALCRGGRGTLAGRRSWGPRPRCC